MIDIQAMAALSRMGPEPLPAWADWALSGIGLVGVLAVGYVFFRAWKDRA